MKPHTPVTAGLVTGDVIRVSRIGVYVYVGPTILPFATRVLANTRALPCAIQLGHRIFRTELEKALWLDSTQIGETPTDLLMSLIGTASSPEALEFAKNNPSIATHLKRNKVSNKIDISGSVLVGFSRGYGSDRLQAQLRDGPCEAAPGLNKVSCNNIEIVNCVGFVHGSLAPVSVDPANVVLVLLVDHENLCTIPITNPKDIASVINEKHVLAQSSAFEVRAIFFRSGTMKTGSFIAVAEAKSMQPRAIEETEEILEEEEIMRQIVPIAGGFGDADDDAPKRSRLHKRRVLEEPEEPVLVAEEDGGGDVVRLFCDSVVCVCVCVCVCVRFVHSMSCRWKTKPKRKTKPKWLMMN